MTFLAVLPSIWPPYTTACLDTMGPALLSRLLVVDNTDTNRGVAASWNIAARRVLTEQTDWLIVVSAATRFGPPGGDDFLDELDTAEGRWVVESAGQAPVVGWHLIAWHRDVLETVGLFDENFWPAYGEDMDYSHRVLTADDTRWTTVTVDARIESVNHGAHLAGVTLDHEASQRYLSAKWGDTNAYRIGPRAWSTPFGKNLPLSWWPTPPDRRAVRHRGWPAS